MNIIRNLCNNVREMRTSRLLDHFFPRTRQAVLSAFLLDPGRCWYLSDLARHLNVTPSALQRELASLTEAGLLHRRADGNRVYYKTEPSFPLLPELTGLFTKTTGVVETIAEALEPFGEQIEYAFIFGSLARGEDTARSDVDLMLIGDVQMTALSLPLRDLQNRLSREVNVSLYTQREYNEKRAIGNHFLDTVGGDHKLWVKGNQNELAIAADGSENPTAHDK